MLQIVVHLFEENANFEIVYVSNDNVVSEAIRVNLSEKFITAYTYIF